MGNLKTDSEKKLKPMVICTRMRNDQRRLCQLHRSRGSENIGRNVNGSLTLHLYGRYPLETLQKFVDHRFVLTIVRWVDLGGIAAISSKSETKNFSPFFCIRGTPCCRK